MDGDLLAEHCTACNLNAIEVGRLLSDQSDLVDHLFQGLPILSGESHLFPHHPLRRKSSSQLHVLLEVWTEMVQGQLIDCAVQHCIARCVLDGDLD